MLLMYKAIPWKSKAIKTIVHNLGWLKFPNLKKSSLVKTYSFNGLWTSRVLSSMIVPGLTKTQFAVDSHRSFVIQSKKHLAFAFHCFTTVWTNDSQLGASISIHLHLTYESCMVPRSCILSWLGAQSLNVEIHCWFFGRVLKLGGRCRWFK